MARGSRGGRCPRPCRNGGGVKSLSCRLALELVPGPDDQLQLLFADCDHRRSYRVEYLDERLIRPCALLACSRFPSGLEDFHARDVPVGGGGVRRLAPCRGSQSRFFCPRPDAGLRCQRPGPVLSRIAKRLVVRFPHFVLDCWAFNSASVVPVKEVHLRLYSRTCCWQNQKLVHPARQVLFWRTVFAGFLAAFVRNRARCDVRTHRTSPRRPRGFFLF